MAYADELRRAIGARLRREVPPADYGPPVPEPPPMTIGEPGMTLGAPIGSSLDLNMRAQPVDPSVQVDWSRMGGQRDPAAALSGVFDRGPDPDPPPIELDPRTADLSQVTIPGSPDDTTAALFRAANPNVRATRNVAGTWEVDDPTLSGPGGSLARPTGAPAPPQVSQPHRPIGVGIARPPDPFAGLPEGLRPEYGGQLYPEDYGARVQTAVDTGAITPEQGDALSQRHQEWQRTRGLPIAGAREQMGFERDLTDHERERLRRQSHLEDERRWSQQAAQMALADWEDTRAERQAQREKAMADQTERYRRAVDQMSEEYETPLGWWNDRSAWGQFGAGLIIAIGAVASSLGGGPNMALEMMDRRMEQDLRDQRQQAERRKGKVEGERNLYELMRAQFDDGDQAHIAAQAAIYDRLASEAERLASQSTQADQAARGKEIATGFRARSASLENDLRQQAYAAQLEQERQRLALLYAQAQQRAQAQREAEDPMGSLEWDRMDHNDRKRYVPGHGLMIDDDEAAKLRGMQADRNTLARIGQEIKALASKPGSSISDVDRARMRALANYGTSAVGRIFQAGAMGDEEFARMRDTFTGDPSSLLSRAPAVAANIDSFVGAVDVNLHATAQANKLEDAVVRQGAKGLEMAFVPRSGLVGRQATTDLDVQSGVAD